MGCNKIDLFTTLVVDVYPRSLDKHGSGLTFHGVVSPITDIETTFQPFLFVRTLPRVRSRQGVYGSETEFTPVIIGIRETKSGVDYTVTATLPVMKDGK